MSLKKELKAATPEEIAEALLALSKKKCPGIAYDVGLLLYEAGASKVVPGPNPRTFEREGKVIIRAIDPARREEAIACFRRVRDCPAPEPFDIDDPKWGKVTKAERRKAERDALRLAGNPELDPAIAFINVFDKNGKPSPMAGGTTCKDMDDPGNTYYVLSDCNQMTHMGRGAQTREDAEALVAICAEYGIKAEILGFDDPATMTHTVSLGSLGVAFA